MTVCLHFHSCFFLRMHIEYEHKPYQLHLGREKMNKLQQLLIQLTAEKLIQYCQDFLQFLGFFFNFKILNKYTKFVNIYLSLKQQLKFQQRTKTINHKRLEINRNTYNYVFQHNC